MSDCRIAYCAGVMDSDGYIGVKRSTYSMRVTEDSSQPTYSERICVKQVEPQAIELLRRPMEMGMQMEAHYQRAKELNRVGC